MWHAIGETEAGTSALKDEITLELPSRNRASSISRGTRVTEATAAVEDAPNGTSRSHQWGLKGPSYLPVNQPDKSWYVIAPGSAAHLVTGWFGVVLTLYIAIAVPLFVSFHLIAEEHSEALWILFVVVDVLLLLEVAMRFVRAYIDKQGKLVSSVSRIAQRYARGYLVFDAIAAFPLSLLLGGSPLAVANQLVRVARVPQMIRPVGVLKLISTTFIRRHHHSLFLGACGIAKIAMYMFLVLHWVACGWHFIATLEDVDTSWVEKDGLAGAHVPKLYVTSFYWAVTTLSTVGYGDINGSTVAERSFCIVVMLCGATLYALCIGSVSHIIASVVRAREALAHKRQHIESFISRYTLPRDLAGQVRWAGELRGESEAAAERHAQSTAEILPTGVRTSVYMYIYKEDIRKVAYLRDLREKYPTFVAAFAAKLQEHAGAKPGDVIMLQGAEPVDMFFLVSGRAIISRKRVPLWELSAGAFFGEAGVLLRSPRLATAMAMEPCQLYTVDASDVRALARRYPAPMGGIAESAQRTLARLLSDGAASSGPPPGPPVRYSSGNTSPSYPRPPMPLSLSMPSPPPRGSPRPTGAPADAGAAEENQAKEELRAAAWELESLYLEQTQRLAEHAQRLASLQAAISRLEAPNGFATQS